MYEFSLRAARLAASFVALASLVVSCQAAPPAESPTRAGGAMWRYEVMPDDGARELRVEVAFPPGTLPELGVMHGATPFIADVETARAGKWRSVAHDDETGAWRVPECATSGCRVRYRVKLRDAARTFGDIDRARLFDGVTVARPAMWMLRPTFAKRGARYRFHVTTPPGTRFATGIFPSLDRVENAYEGDASMLASAAYTAFGPFEIRHVDFAGADVVVAMQPGVVTPTSAQVDAWVASSARIVGAYFGCFPVSRVAVVIVATDGDDVQRGHALGDGGAGIVVEVGRNASEGALRDDWVLPHEMVHLGFPSVDRQHHWLEEGIATYVQPIARARAGALAPEDVWKEFARGMPKGLPRANDHGLDHTPTWGRTYWGGAIFCLVADLEIRKLTGNRYALDDALRAIVAAGGNISVEWDLAKALDAGDRAVGVPVLHDLYAKMANRPVRVDLDDYWRSLGVGARGGSSPYPALDDGAPLAALRRSITLPSATSDARAGDVAACPTEASASTQYARKLR